MSVPFTAAVHAIDPGALGRGDQLVVAGALGEVDEPDVVVVGVARPADLADAQRVHRDHPEAGLVLVIPAQDPAEVRRALSYAPGIPVEVEVVAADEPDRLVDRATVAADRATRLRRHRALLATIDTTPQPPGPALGSASAALVSVVDRAPLGVVVVGTGGELVSWNARARQTLALEESDEGRAVGELFDQADLVRDLVTDSAAGDGFSPAVTVSGARRAASLELHAVGTEQDDGRRVVLLLLVDVSIRRAAEEARDVLRDRLRVVRRSQEFLLRASDVLARATDYTDTLVQLAEVAVPALGDLCLIDVVEDGELRRAAARHADPAAQPLADVLRQNPPAADGDHPAAQALRAGAAHWDPDITDRWMVHARQDPGHAEALRELDPSGYIAVPLVADGETLGVVTVVVCGGRRVLGPDDVVLAEELGARVAQVVAKARRYDREHEIAVVLQRSMLTALPPMAPFTVAARYAPARRDTQVGGDWYDAFVPPGAPPVLVIGDVVGHDLTAATAMGQLRSAVRALAWRRSTQPASVLEAVDDFVVGSGLTGFATVTYATVEPVTAGARLQWSSAGHLPPLVVGPDGAAHFLPAARDLVLGVVGARHSRTEQLTTLAPGSTLVLYTDGLVEHRSSPLWVGMEELRSTAAELATAPLEDQCDGILRALARNQEDDVALLALRVPN